MENFVIIEGEKYYESALRLMNEGQLNNLIKKCQAGIDEIAVKKADYEDKNYNSTDLDHYYEVIKKFNSASVYLQSDIVLISRILKAKSNNESICDRNDWFEEFFHITASKLSRRKMQKLIKITEDTLGYKINFGA